MIWWIVGLAILSGVFYRLGGWSKGNRLFRILGCPLCVILACMGLFWGKNVPFWTYILTFGLNAGAVSAYWGIDEKKFGYWAHGLGLSLAVLPIAYVTCCWLGFGIRTLVLTALMTLWSEYTSCVRQKSRSRP